MNEDQWIPFEGVRQLHDKRGPLVTIQARAAFGLNRRAVEALGNPARVVFLYNKHSRAIGLRAARESETYAYPLRRQEHADSYVLNGRLFLEQIEYPIGQLRRFEPRVMGNVLVLDLEPGHAAKDDTRFEEFQGRKQRTDKRNPLVSIQAQGNVGMNRAAHEALGLPEEIVFLYNKGRQAIGIQAATAGSPAHAYKLRKQNRADSYVAHARAFLQFVDYTMGELRVFQPKVEGRTLVIELDAEQVKSD